METEPFPLAAILYNALSRYIWGHEFVKLDLSFNYRRLILGTTLRKFLIWIIINLD